METQDAGGQTALARSPLGGCRGRPPCWTASQRVWSGSPFSVRKRGTAALGTRTPGGAGERPSTGAGLPRVSPHGQLSGRDARPAPGKRCGHTRPCSGEDTRDLGRGLTVDAGQVTDGREDGLLDQS